MPRLTSTLSLFLPTIPSLFIQPTTSTYTNDNTSPSNLLSIAPPIHLSPTLPTSTHSAFYPYPTSSAQHQNTSYHHHNTQSYHPLPYSTYATYISLNPASGYPISLSSPSENGTYQAPVLSTPQKDTSTTALSTTSSASSYSNASSNNFVSASPSSGTTQDITTTAESASPTKDAEPAEPMFTGSALRLPELQVWKWNIIVSVGLGLMVMWI
jgi:hypothetical protein